MIKRKAYLTIDDSPSERMDDMTDALALRGIPAIFFCRGDFLEQRLDQAERAIRKGFIIANHAWHHRRATRISLEEMTDEIVKTQNLIEQAYQNAGEEKHPRYFRFPQMDRGMGGWVVDYDLIAEEDRDHVVRMFADGLNITLDPPDQAGRDKCRMLQHWLAAQGFVSPAFNDVSFPWFRNTELGQAVDAMYTYSTSDWMLTARHKGKWPWKTLDDLKKKIDDDVCLKDASSAHIILAHDHAEILDETLALIDHMTQSGIEFKL